MRLTEKRVIHPSCKVNGELENREYIHVKDKNLAEKKLFELEDIEDELGIDLAILFKALKQGFYFKDDFGDIIHFEKELLQSLIKGKVQDLKKELKDYGKTWALTKEELL